MSHGVKFTWVCQDEMIPYGDSQLVRKSRAVQCPCSLRGEPLFFSVAAATKFYDVGDPWGEEKIFRN